MSKDLQKYVGAIGATGFAPGSKDIKGKKSKINFSEFKSSKGKPKKRLKEAYNSAKKAFGD